MVKRTIFGTEVDIEIDEDVFPTKEEIDANEANAPGVQHGWFESSHENAKLSYYCWLPENGEKPKGVVVFMHGIVAHGFNCLVVDGRKLSASLLADTFTKNGYAAYCFDMRGHGYSEGTRFWIPHWKKNKQDLINFTNMVSKKHSTEIPLFLSGESYGACLALHVARYFQDNPNDAPSNFDSVLLSAPAIIGDLPPYLIVLFLRYVLAPLFPKWKPPFMPNPISADRIWRDEAVRSKRTNKRFEEMGLEGCGKPFVLGTGVHLLGAMEEVRGKAIPGLTVPFCIIHGTEDYGVPITGSEYLMEKSATPEEQREFHRMEGAYHDLFGDPLAGEAIGHWVSFVDKRQKACAV